MVDSKHTYEYEIIFDKTNPNWMGYSADNIFMLGHLEDTVNINLYHNGYIYLNQIYEILGLKWDPKDYNRCFIADPEHKRPFEFNVFKQNKDSMKVIMRCQLYETDPKKVLDTLNECLRCGEFNSKKCSNCIRKIIFGEEEANS